MSDQSRHIVEINRSLRGHQLVDLDYGEADSQVTESLLKQLVLGDARKTRTELIRELCSRDGFRRRIGDGLDAAKRATEIGEHLSDDWVRSHGEIISAHLLVSSGSVTQGLRLADQARQRAEPVNDTMLGSDVALVGGVNYFHLGDPNKAQDWYTSELAKPRAAPATVRRLTGLSALADVCVANC